MIPVKWVAVVCLTCAFLSGYGQVTGRVYGEDAQPLQGALVYLLPDRTGTTTDTQGQFVFRDIKPAGKHTFQISYLGYETLVQTVDFDREGALPLDFRLEVKGELLETVVITEEHAKQEMTLASEHFGEDLIEQNMQGAFAKTIESLPGISAINVGVGIAKPVIRGLSSNRIIVNQQGIKQESHQWGADHGLEVDQFDVERVEIIKGPASLQYGSDGLGGVINILPGRMLPRNTFAGTVQGVFKDNNNHWGGSGFLHVNIDDIFVSARYSRQEFGDYGVPANQFVYNNFVLPIYNERLKNTAGREENIRISAGIKRNGSITRILFGHYALDAGLFSGAVGIPRSYALTDDGNPRDIDVPRQAVDHYRVSFHQTYFFGEDHLDINIGYQRNVRREFSFPEFHSIPSSLIETNNTLALQLELETYSANLHYEFKPANQFKTVIGGNVQWQDNKRGGFEFLLPDFRTFRTGLFVFSEWEIDAGWNLNGGIRGDYGKNRTDFFRQWIWDSNENIVDSLIAPTTDQSFFNWSGSIGLNRRINAKWDLKVNFGKSFRVPYPAETVSNGIHHGTFRHEVGTPDLKSEHGYQFDLSADLLLDRFSATASVYFNYFDNYIYLGPTFPARFSPLPEAGQIFQYRQDDAIYTGFELTWSWEVLKGLRLNQTADFVQSYNQTTGLALPFTPQPALKHQLRYIMHDKGFLEEWFFELGHQYFFAAEGQYRVDRSEQETPAYQLWQIGTGARLLPGGQPVQINLQVQNLFNVRYLNHLSRYRLINVPEQGRNIVLSLKVPFSGQFSK